MTKGLAIIAMLTLHLFCRTGADVYGKPIIWLTDTVPFVAWFGFMAEICVPLYSICVGYAYCLLFDAGKNKFPDRIKRVLRLLVIYWTVLCVFCLIGIFVRSSVIPGTITDFLLNFILFRSYNGAWWFLHSYVFLLLIPSGIVLFLKNRCKLIPGLIICFLVETGWYIINRFFSINLFQDIQLLNYAITELYNLIKIIPYIWAGTLLCRDNVICEIDCWLSSVFSLRKRKYLIYLSWIAMFLVINILHKSVLMGIAGLWVFLSFNLWQKPEPVKSLFLFLGKHSTNIWLTHMFFYMYMFNSWMGIVKYPVLIFAFLLGVCLISSTIIMKVQAFFMSFLYRVYYVN